MKIKLLLFTCFIFSQKFSFAADSLKVNAVVRHINWMPDSLGKIELQISNGVPPYQVHWDDIGISGETRRALYARNYTATVTDHNGRFKKVSARIKYSQEIKKSNTLTFSPDSVFPSNPDSTGYFISENTLEPNQPGTLETVLKDLKGERKFGVSSDSLGYSIEFGFIQVKSKLFIIAENKIKGYYGKVKRGDTLRLSIDGSHVSFLNGNKLLTRDFIPSKPYHSVLSLKESSQDSPLISSFNFPLSAHMQITDNTCDHPTRGKVNIRNKGGEGPYEIRIYKGEQADNTKLTSSSNLESGKYRIQVKDHSGELIDSIIRIGTQFSWKNSSSFTIDSSSIHKNSQDGWCNSVITSQNNIARDSSGWIEFQLTDTNSILFAGLSNRTLATEDYKCTGLFFKKGELISVSIDQDGMFEKQLRGFLQPGDRFYFAQSPSGISIRKNGTVLFELPPFLEHSVFEIAAYSNNSSLKNIRSSFQCR